MQKHPIIYGKQFKQFPKPTLVPILHKKRTNKEVKFLKTGIFSFTNIKVLALAKQRLEELPTHQLYELGSEADYARIMAQTLPLFKHIRIEQIQFIVSVGTFSKLLVQLTRQTEHKQIVLTLLKEILKGGENYQELVLKDLYDILSFMIEMDSLNCIPVESITPQNNSASLKQAIISTSVYQLLKGIVKWFGSSPSGKPISTKYSSLLSLFLYPLAQF